MDTGGPSWPAISKPPTVVNWPPSAMPIPWRGSAPERLIPASRYLATLRRFSILPHIDAVAIITPVWTHFEFAKAALENGKHVFVEKPFTASSAEASQLIDLAAARKLQIMVDHTFLFTGAVRKIRQLIDEGVLGKLFYYDSSRINLGLFQHDVNVIWDLAPHDLADHGLPDRRRTRKRQRHRPVPPQRLGGHGVRHHLLLQTCWPTST